MVTSYIDRVNYFFFFKHSLFRTQLNLGKHRCTSCLKQLSLKYPSLYVLKNNSSNMPWFGLCFILLNVIVVQSPSSVQLFATPWTASRQTSLSLITSWNWPKLMFIASVMSSRRLILSRPLLLRPSVFPSIKVFQ